MLGLTSRHGFTVSAAPAEDFQIIIDQPVVDALRMQIPVLRVDDLFEVTARNAYNAFGRPPLDNILLAWEIFSSIVP